MKLNNARDVCKKINEDAAYAFLFEPISTDWEKRVNLFLDKFANKHGLEANTVAMGAWSFSHNTHGQLNDGVIELDMSDTKPVFNFKDVSKAKITDNSPNFHADITAAKNRIKDAKIEYIDKLKTVINSAKDGIEGLSFNLQDRSPDSQSSLALDPEIQDLQNKYHLTMDRLQEIQGSTKESYESLKANVEMSLISLKHSIENTESKIDSKF